VEFIFNKVFKLKGVMQPVPFSAIPKPLMKDFLAFIQYRAVLKRHGEWLVQPGDFKEWLRKLNEKGVDYQIDLNAYEVDSAEAT